MNKPKSTPADKLHGQRLRLMMSGLDFRHALSAATFLAEECKWESRCSYADLRKFKCYETTLVVAYGRPFAHSRSHEPPFRWNLLGPAFTLQPDEAALHAKMLEFRNKLYAHSDGDVTRITPEIWRFSIRERETWDFLASQGGEALNFEEEEVHAIHTFLWKVRHHIDEAIQAHPAPRDGIPVRIMGDAQSRDPEA
jgi:hypothetical protein